MSFEEKVSRVIRHDLVNVLFLVQAYSEMGQSEELRKINYQIKKAFSIIEVWKELEDNAEEPSWWELKYLLSKAVAQSGYPVEVEVDENIKVKTNGLFHFVFTNLIDNSMRHGGRDIKIKISSKIEDSDLLIIYEDNGVGIPESEKERIFCQGFGKHTGLGMFFSRQIIELMGGTIVENGSNGARFEIRLPKDIYKMSNEES